MSEVARKKIIYKNIGKKVRDYCGFTLPEISCRLREFGKGRIVARKSQYNKCDNKAKLNYAYLLTRCEPQTYDKYLKRGKFWANEIVDGEIQAKEVEVQDAYRIDWMLLSKKESSLFRPAKEEKKKPLEEKIELPKLFESYLSNIIVK